MNPAEKQIYRFADVEVNISQNCLKRGNQERHLRQKAFSVLVHLLEQRQRVVSKDELMEIVWKDAAVTDDALVQCIKEIRRSIGDNSHHSRFIKTIPKTGYRFIGEVEEPKNESRKNTAGSPAENIKISRMSRLREFVGNRKLLTALLFFTVAVSLVVFLDQNARREQNAADTTLPQIAGKKSLAVMYFENQTGGGELDWMREGLADMLITNLSRSNKINVLSRQQLHLLLERSGFQADSEIPFEQTIDFARKSRAEYFVTGSFAKAGEKIRIDAQLHDANNGALLAAERLIIEKPEQILTEIDLVSIKLIKYFSPNELENQTNLAEVMTDNLEAYRYYSLAVEKARGLHKKDALELLEKAIARDPEFAMAYARIGYIYAISWGRAADGRPYLEKAFALSDRLTEKDRLNIAAWYAIANLDYPAAIRAFREIIAKYPLETEAYSRLGYLLRGEEQFDEAISVMRQGLTIDPESAALYNALGLLYSLLGRHDEAIAAHLRYVALEPAEANARDSLGMSYQWAGRYEEAIGEYTRSLELNPNFEIAHVHLGVAYFQTGRYRTAIEWFKKYIAVAPSTFESARGYFYIAHVYRKLKNYEAAVAAAKKAFEENKSYVFELYSAALESGDETTAKKLKEQLFVKEENSNRGSRITPRVTFYFRGYIALKNGQTNEATENFLEALRHSPQTWDIDPLEDCLANAYLELGRFDEAAAEYHRILKLNPNYPLARFYLAQALKQKGLKEEARIEYQKFLAIWNEADPDIPEIIAARKIIDEN